MSVLKKLLLGFVVLLLVVAAIGLVLPRTAHVERSIVINARPATVFTVLNGFRQFDQWSPWAEYDPGMKLVFEGPATGVGARYRWNGNAQVGSGSQEILESTPYRQIRIKLVFGEFPGDFIAHYILAPEGEGTRLTWAFDADYGITSWGDISGCCRTACSGRTMRKV